MLQLDKTVAENVKVIDDMLDEAVDFLNMDAY